jgi:CRP-like cAMP-binding protein/HEAT repeat protein
MALSMPWGLTLAGGLLWVCEQRLSLSQITALAGGLTLVLLAVRLPMGRFYAQGLEVMIRAGTLNLDTFSEDQNYLPPQSSEVIRELLTNADRYTQIKGLELASYTGNPSQFLPEVMALLPTDGQRQERIVHLFSHEAYSLAELQPFTELLTVDQPALQTTALEVLMANPHYQFSDDQLAGLQQAQVVEVRVLAKIACKAQQQQALNLETLEPDEVTPAVMGSLVRIFTASQRPQWLPLIAQLLPLAAAEIKCKCLAALMPLATPGNIQLTELALGTLNHPDPTVRGCALKLLQRTRCEEALEVVAERLGDPDPRVRQQVAQTLAAFRQQGLALAKKRLSSSDPATVDAAIAAIGQVRSRTANDILYSYLAPAFQQMARTRKWQQQIPDHDPDWQLLAVAIANYHQQLIHRVLYVLACLGYARTVNTVTQILTMTDPTDLANAVEVLASLRHRRFVLPLIPLLEQAVKPTSAASKIKKRPAVATLPWLRTKGYRLLLSAMESQDRWIRTGALVALSRVPSALMDDPDPVVQSMARQLLPTANHSALVPPPPMNRLLLLKDVALFKNLSLDELWLIEQALDQVQVLAGETIFTEGSWGAHLYIVASGCVQLVKQVDGNPRNLKQVTAGGYFGEIALFDDAPRWNGAIAMEDSVLLKLEKNRFISLITQRPHIVLELCRFLSQQLRETDSLRSLRPADAEYTSSTDTTESSLENSIQ